MHPDVMIYIFGSLLLANIKQAIIEQKSDQEKIPSTLPMLTPKKNLKNRQKFDI